MTIPLTLFFATADGSSLLSFLVDILGNTVIKIPKKSIITPKKIGNKLYNIHAFLLYIYLH